MRKLKITLAGNPNVGKSTIFNALTGLKQHTGNWPGKTVGIAKGSYEYNDKIFEIYDIPGTYSLISHSKEEEVARDFITENNNLTIVVCDATCLERNLNLVLQTLEITNRVIVCINLIDEAEKKKIDDLKKKYSGKRNVVLCDSLPSLEYWFLLHYADTNKYFANCHALLQELKKFIPEYKKSEAFLQSPKWVEDMTLEGKLATAVERSKKYEGQGGSYSNVYKAIDIMCQTK